jgi:hypothetical protein
MERVGILERRHTRMFPLFCITSFAMQISATRDDGFQSHPTPPPPFLSTAFYSTHLFIYIFPSNTFLLLLQWFPKFQFSHASFSTTYLLKSSHFFFFPPKGPTYSFLFCTTKFYIPQSDPVGLWPNL